MRQPVGHGLHDLITLKKPQFCGAITQMGFLRVFMSCVKHLCTPIFLGFREHPMPGPDRAGGEILVNTSLNFDQLAPSGTRLSNGTYIIVWHDTNNASDGSQASVKAQLYAADGTPIGTEFRCNTFTTGNQQDASVAALAGGGFVVSWSSFLTYPGDGSAAVVAQVFDAAGTKVGSEILVNTTTLNTQWQPDIAALANGGFAIAFTDFSATGGDTSGRAVRMQVFNADATRSGGELLVNTNTFQNQDLGVVTQLNSGAIAVAWVDSGPLGSLSVASYVKVRLYTGGVPGAEITVSTTTTGNQSNADIVALAGGRFVVVWTDYSGANGDPVSGIRARLFEADGTAIGSEFSVNLSINSRQDAPSVAALTDGGFVVTWDDLSLTQDTSEYGILGQLFDSNGARVGTEFLVNTTTNSFQRNSAVFATSDGFFVAFTDQNGSVGETNLGPNIRGQRFLLAVGDRSFTADGGNDSYAGGAGFDTVDYSAATGPIFADLRGGANPDGFGAADSYTSIEGFIGGTGDDTVIGSGADNRIAGGAGSDYLMGLGGNDELIGGAGPNALQGGMGDDLYRVSDRGDTITEFSGEGTDTIIASTAAFVLPEFVENLSAASDNAAFIGIGNSGDNVLRGSLLSDALGGGAGNDTLYGRGGAANELVGGTGDDVYVVEVTGDSTVEAVGEGTDTVQTALSLYSLQANVENLVFTGTGAFIGAGNADDNGITGGAAADELYGLGGADVLIGGGGNDLLFGGAGTDVFRYIGNDGIDRILDFTSGNDRIQLSAAQFGAPAFSLVQGAGVQAATAAGATFMYDSDTGFLRYDADGNGAGAAITLAQLNFGLTLQVGDYSFG